MRTRTPDRLEPADRPCQFAFRHRKPEGFEPSQRHGSFRWPANFWWTAQESNLPSCTAVDRLHDGDTVDPCPRHRALPPPTENFLVDSKGVEPSSADCEPAALPLSYEPDWGDRRTRLFFVCFYYTKLPFRAAPGFAPGLRRCQRSNLALQPLIFGRAGVTHTRISGLHAPCLVQSIARTIRALAERVRLDHRPKFWRGSRDSHPGHRHSAVPSRRRSPKSTGTTVGFNDDHMSRRRLP